MNYSDDDKDELENSRDEMYAELTISLAATEPVAHQREVSPPAAALSEPHFNTKQPTMEEADGTSPVGIQIGWICQVSSL